VQYIHNCRILHRDLKSQNIFLTSSGAVKIGDFGIARVLEASEIFAETCIGTPSNLPPEVCRNLPYDFKVDVWGLGIILYEMLALELPFKATSCLALALEICSAEPKPIPTVYSSEVRTLVGCLLAKVTEHRPSSAEILTLPHVRRSIAIMRRTGKCDLHATVHGSEVLAGSSVGPRAVPDKTNKAFCSGTDMGAIEIQEPVSGGCPHAGSTFATVSNTTVCTTLETQDSSVLNAKAWPMMPGTSPLTQHFVGRQQQAIGCTVKSFRMELAKRAQLECPEDIPTQVSTTKRSIIDKRNVAGNGPQADKEKTSLDAWWNSPGQRVSAEDLAEAGLDFDLDATPRKSARTSVDVLVSPPILRVKVTVPCANPTPVNLDGMEGWRPPQNPCAEVADVMRENVPSVELDISTTSSMILRDLEEELSDVLI